MDEFDKPKSQLIEENRILQQRVERLDNELLRSKLFGDMIIASAGEGIAVLDRDLCYVLWNPYMENLLGLPASDVLGRHVFDVFPQLLEENLDKVLADALNGVTTRSVDTRYNIAQSGKIGWASALYTPHYSTDGEIIGVIALVDDITERKNAEIALIEREAGFRALFEGAPDAILLVDVETQKIIDANPAATNLFLRSTDELLSMNHWELYPFYLEDKVRSDFHGHVIEQASNVPIEYVVLRGDGKKIIVELSVQQIRLNGRSVMQGIFRDLSVRIESENQKFQLALEHERRQLLASFITDVSHEFRTPLSTIKTRTYLLNRLLKSDEYSYHIGVINSQVDDLANLVNNLVTMSKLDMGEPFNFERLSLDSILKQVIDTRSDAIERKHLKCKMDMIDGEVVADKEYLALAISHILDNAIKYTPDEGIIAISMAHVDGETVLIDVTDSGRGIREVHLPHVWKRFYQGDEQPDMRGFGLGLPIALAIIKQHGGDVDIQSTEGKGSSVQITLPLTVSA